MSGSSKDLTHGSIRAHLVRLTLPMIGGILAMSAFHLTDTYFIAQLGEGELAAISFTFPVVMVIGSIALGMGMGASILISRAIGSGAREQAKRLATNSLLLAVFSVAAVAFLGLTFLEPLFTALGAGPEVMPLIRSYMTLWFSCVWALIVPMVGNNCIRGTGDTFTPGLIMIGLAGMNLILDPIFIFGFAGIPPMGIFGAALATVLSRGVGTVCSLWLLVHRYDLVDWKRPELAETLRQWGAIAHVALPSAATRLLMPLSMGIVTRFVAPYGNAAVAAVGSSGRLLHLLYIVPIAMGSVLVPFSGQNWGAGRRDRVRAAWSMGNRFSLYYGLACLLLAIPLVVPAGQLFGEGAAFLWAFQAFLLVALAASGMQHVAVHSGFVLNAIGYPVGAFLFNAARALLLLVPLIWLGNHILGLAGIFLGMAASQVISGLGIRALLPRLMKDQATGSRQQGGPCPTGSEG